MFRTGGARTSTLRRAASVVFALISVLPLLLFAYTLYTLDVLHHHVAQIGLGSALVLAMLGFYIYSVMISRLSDILRGIEVGESTPPPVGTPQGPEASVPVDPGAGGPQAARSASGGPRQSTGKHAGTSGRLATGGASVARRRGGLVVPGMGRITELKPADARALSDLDFMWRAEAQPLLGKRVLVAVRNDPDPMRGVLVEVTKVGLILDQDGSMVSISYTRLSMIEEEKSASPPSGA